MVRFTYEISAIRGGVFIPFLWQVSISRLNYKLIHKEEVDTKQITLPMIAILMAVYNGATFLESQIVSVLEQNYPNFRLYIRDDGSTDGSVGILEEMARQFPDKIVLLQDETKRLGVIGNFHRLLGYIERSGLEPYIMLSDQDDVWFPDKIEVTLHQMLETEGWAGQETPVLIHTDLCVTNTNLEILAPSFWHFQRIDPSRNDLPQICMQNTVTGCTVMMNRALFQKALPVPEGVLMHDWWLGLVASAFGEIRFVPRATMYYRQHGNNHLGATVFDLSHVYKSSLRLRSSSEFWRSLQPVQHQAELFLTAFKNKLPPNTVEDLQLFSRMTAHTRIIQRLQIAFIRRFCRHGWIRNLGLAVRLFFY